MSGDRQRKIFGLAPRWVFVSYFAILGTLCVTYAVLAVHRLTGRFESHALYAIASIVGGYLAARVSRARTVREGAVAATMVAGTMVLLARSMKVELFTKDFDHVAVPLGVALVAYAGALLGGKLGGKLGASCPQRAADRGLAWLLYVTLQIIGACFAWSIAMIALAHTAKAHQLPMLRGAAGLAILLAPAIGGIAVQLSTSRKAAAEVLLAIVPITVGGLVLALTKCHASGSSFWVSFTLITAIFATVACAFASAGAAIARAFGWQCAEPPHTELPSARLE